MASRNTQPVIAAFNAIKETTLSPPISLEELRAVLMSEICPEPQLVPVNTDVPIVLNFRNIFDFTAWYSSNRDGFNPKQQEALDTLIKTRDLVEQGCSCKRSGREMMAHNYFANFWTNNKNTDLMETIAKVANAKIVTIRPFCAFPSDQL